jgi:hypothetical protein
MSTPYQPENDDRQPELRPGVASTIAWWPKRNGQNVALAADPTFTIHTPTGAQIQAGTASRTTVGGYSRVDIAVSAIATRGCGYQVRLTYQAPGAPSEDAHVLPFDVVVWPIEPEVSLNDLLSMRADIGRTLDRLASYLSPAPSTAAMAAHYVVQAVNELDSRLRSQIRADAEANPGANRPSAILNRGPLNRWLRLATMRLIYAADGGSAEGEKDKDRGFQFYTMEARGAWAGLSPLEYDDTGDLVADDVDTGRGNVVHVRRSW